MRFRKNQTIFLSGRSLSFQRVLHALMYGVIMYSLITGCERTEVLFNKETVTLNEAGIDQVSPAHLEKSVAVNPIVSVNFMAGTYMTDLSGMDLSLKRGTEDVHGSMTFKGMTAAFKPDDDLISESEYTATLKTNRMEMSGEKREIKYTWKFNTGTQRHDYSRSILTVSPEDEAVNVPVTTSLTITFSKDLTPFLENIASVTLKKSSTPVYGSLTFSGTTATFTPSASLSQGTEYTARVIFGAGDNYFYNDKSRNYSSWTFKTEGSAGDVIPPTVVSVVPANNAGSVATSSNITVTFSEPMNTSTINSSTITLKRGTTAVSGTVAVSGATATFTPSGSLVAGAVYTGTVTTGVKDAAGNALTANYTWNFTTTSQADVTPPSVLTVVPAINAASVALGSQITATFSEPMNSTTITSSTFTLKQGTTTVAGTVSCSGATATFAPSVALSASTVYTANITTGATDASGNALAASYTWNFTTTSQADVTPPTVLTVVPANGATSIALNSQITATFSEAMTSSTITSSTFTLTQGSTAITGTVSYSGTTATFIPASALAGSTVYTATVTTGVKDVAGNALSTAKTWTFTTVAPAPAGMSFATDVVPVLTLCNNCHTHPWTVSSNPSTFYTNLVNAGYVNPASYTSSKIYTKLNGGHPGSAISTTNINKILTWMKEGSKNN